MAVEADVENLLSHVLGHGDLGFGNDIAGSMDSIITTDFASAVLLLDMLELSEFCEAGSSEDDCTFPYLVVATSCMLQGEVAAGDWAIIGKLADPNEQVEEGIAGLKIELAELVVFADSVGERLRTNANVKRPRGNMMFCPRQLIVEIKIGFVWKQLDILAEHRVLQQGSEDVCICWQQEFNENSAEDFVLSMIRLLSGLTVVVHVGE